MKIEMCEDFTETREVAAVITSSGVLLMPFNSEHCPNQKTVSLGYAGTVTTNGTMEVKDMNSSSYKKLYKGDKVTITF